MKHIIAPNHVAALGPSSAPIVVVERRTKMPVKTGKKAGKLRKGRKLDATKPLIVKAFPNGPC